jgi:hypothetical protein
MTWLGACISSVPGSTAGHGGVREAGQRLPQGPALHGDPGRTQVN